MLTFPKCIVFSGVPCTSVQLLCCCCTPKRLRRPLTIKLERETGTSYSIFTTWLFVPVRMRVCEYEPFIRRVKGESRAGRANATIRHCIHQCPRGKSFRRLESSVSAGLSEFYVTAWHFAGFSNIHVALHKNAFSRAAGEQCLTITVSASLSVRITHPRSHRARAILKSCWFVYQK